MKVTRVEIADVLAPALARGPRTSSEIVSFAAAAGARPEVVAMLQDLPEQTFGDMRALWPHLSHVPVEA